MSSPHLLKGDTKIKSWYDEKRIFIRKNYADAKKLLTN
jgi:hypothetical protein